MLLFAYSCNEGALAICQHYFLMKQQLQIRLPDKTGNVVKVGDTAIAIANNSACSSFSPAPVANTLPAVASVATASAAVARAVALCPRLLDDFLRVESAWSSMSRHFRNIFCSIRELDEIGERAVVSEFFFLLPVCFSIVVPVEFTLLAFYVFLCFLFFSVFALFFASSMHIRFGVYVIMMFVCSLLLLLSPLFVQQN